VKHRTVLLTVILALILSSCVLPGGKTAEPTVAPLPPTAAPAEPTNPPPPPPTAEPAAPAAPAAPAVDTAPTAEAAPADTGGGNFTEEFDLANEDWSKDTWITTQAAQYREETKPSMVSDGLLEFHLNDKETYIYKFHNGDVGQDVTIETKFVSKGQPNNGVALVCRVAPDLSTWYEARVSPQGKWSITLYDRSLKENEDKNPYIPQKEGVMRPKLVFPTRPNTVKFSCVGTKLTLTVNGEEVYTRNSNELMESGMVGLGVMSYDNLPVIVDFDYFSLTSEQ
jgi:hypothetical protein